MVVGRVGVSGVGDVGGRRVWLWLRRKRGLLMMHKQCSPQTPLTTKQ
jgi:hypothetical protein